MSHELTKREDGSYEMFYTGEVPWHGLGQQIGHLATAEEAIRAGHLDWEVIKEPVKTQAGKELKDRFLTLRKDTGVPLGVVSDRYHILQNLDAFKFMDAITMDPHGPKYSTAGSLWGGRKVWMLADLGALEIVQGDPVNRFLLVSNAHDASGAVNVMLTPVRVVCANTLSMAFSDPNGGHVKIRHTGDIKLKVDKVQEALGIIVNKFDETFDLYRMLADVKPTEEQIDTVLANLFPDTVREGRAKTQRERVKLLSVSGRGNDNEAVTGTAWGLYNGVTELYDHFNGATSMREDRADYRLASNWWGLGAKAKGAALDTICRVCKVEGFSAN